MSNFWRKKIKIQNSSVYIATSIKLNHTWRGISTDRYKMPIHTCPNYPTQQLHRHCQYIICTANVKCNWFIVSNNLRTRKLWSTTCSNSDSRNTRIAIESITLTVHRSRRIVEIFSKGISLPYEMLRTNENVMLEFISTFFFLFQITIRPILSLRMTTKR